MQLTPPSTLISAPLALCLPADVPPKAVAEMRGYTQFAVSAMDPAGHPIAGLKQSDFELYADRQVLPIEYFREEQPPAPTSIVFVIDLSGSMADKLVAEQSRIDTVRKSLTAFADKLNRCDEVAILAFGGHEGGSSESISSQHVSPDRDAPTETTIRLLQPFTTDHRLALTRVADLTPYGQTPLYDTMLQGLNLLATSHYSNRVLVVITDGIDNTSETKKERLIANIDRSGVLVFAIGIGDPAARDEVSILIGPFQMGSAKSGRVDAETLKDLAAANGGRLFIVSPVKQDAGVALIDALTAIAADLSPAYAIGALVPAGTDHPQIAVVNRPEIKPSAHPIYYSPLSTPSSPAPPK